MTVFSILEKIFLKIESLRAHINQTHFVYFYYLSILKKKLLRIKKVVKFFFNF